MRPAPQFTGRDVAVGIRRIGQPNLKNIPLISGQGRHRTPEKVSIWGRVGSAESDPHPRGWRFESPLRDMRKSDRLGERLPGGEAAL